MTNEKTFEIDEDAVVAFWDRVKRRGGNDCWQWMGTLTPRGTGRLMIRGKNYSAHHVAWHLDSRSFPRGHVLERLDECNNRGCVRPDHYRLATRHQACSRGGKKSFRQHTDRVRNGQESPQDDATMFHVKQSAEVAHQQLSLSREGLLMKQLVQQAEKREAMWEQALSQFRVALGELRRDATQRQAVAAKLDELKQAVAELPRELGESLGQPAAGSEAAPRVAAAAASGAGPDMSLADVLVSLYVKAKETDDPVCPSVTRRLMKIFDEAVDKSAGHGPAGLQMFRSWLAAWRYELPKAHRTIANLESIARRD